MTSNERVRLRFVITNGFPYLLFYQDESERIVLLRLLHMSRDISVVLGRRCATANTVPAPQNPL